MAVTGQKSRNMDDSGQPTKGERLPRSVRSLLWISVILAIAALTYRVYPHMARPFRQAAAVEAANMRIERVRYEKQRERNRLRRQLELAETDEGKADILRRSRYQREGWSHLVGDGVGSPPSER
mgnify:CR=1 FL=1